MLGIIPEKKQAARILRQNPTQAEQVLWEKVRRKQIRGLRFRRQHVINGYIVDFYCHKLNLIIEIDGSSHNNKKEYDDFRQNEIKAKSGSHFLRFSNQEVINHTEDVLQKIKTFTCKRM